MTKVRNFRAKDYKDLGQKFQTRSAGIRAHDGESVYQARKDAIRMLDSGETHRVASELGWDDDWCSKLQKKRRGAAEGDEREL